MRSLFRLTPEAFAFVLFGCYCAFVAAFALFHFMPDRGPVSALPPLLAVALWFAYRAIYRRVWHGR